MNLQLRREVVTAVDEEIDRSKAAREEASPPPVIILGTQMKVAKQDCRLRAGDDENQEHEKQETEHVVHLIGPQRVQNEEQLDEDAACGREWNISNMIKYLFEQFHQRRIFSARLIFPRISTNLFR